MSRSHKSPLVVLPDWRLPPVILVPGAIPAQDARCAAVGNRDMSTPISAMIVSAARLPTPVMVSSRSRARWRGAGLTGVRGEPCVDLRVEGGDGSLEVVGVVKA